MEAQDGAMTAGEIDSAEIVAYHEAGHCVAARVLGFSILGEGCTIIPCGEIGGSAAIDMDAAYADPPDGLVAILSGPVAEIRCRAIAGGDETLDDRGPQILWHVGRGMGLLDGEDAACERGSIFWDIERVIDLIGRIDALSGARENERVVLKVAVLSMWGVTREVVEDVWLKPQDLPLGEWYRHLKLAADTSVCITKKHWTIVVALARQLLQESSMSGPRIVEFLDAAGCPTRHRPPVQLAYNPFRRPPSH